MKREVKVNKVSGKKGVDREYTDRVGVYGLCCNSFGKIPLISARLYNGKLGYFLVGGFIGKEESVKGFLMQKFYKEANCIVKVKDCISSSDLHYCVQETEEHIYIKSTFYEVDILESEVDVSYCKLVWATIDEALTNLHREDQITAVAKYLKCIKERGV